MERNKRIKKNIPYLLLFILFILFIFVVQVSKNTDDKKIDNRDKTEKRLIGLDIEDIKEIQLLNEERSLTLKSISDTKDKIDIYRTLTQYSYGKANHPSSINSSALYISLVGDNDKVIYLIRVIIMNEGFNSNTAFFYIMDEFTHRYHSESLYHYLVNEGVYDHINRKLF